MAWRGRGAAWRRVHESLITDKHSAEEEAKRRGAPQTFVLQVVNRLAEDSAAAWTERQAPGRQTHTERKHRDGLMSVACG